ncbi:hypothetical protein [Actinacidiphila alni]|uniref:hypothetical protein n=1 Tax=Actinacidiphila alni TaxID=380248 RepID=UPI003455D96E
MGGIDHPDSAVDFAVTAPAAGTYRFTVGYANGTTAAATHRVTVGGSPQGSTSCQPTGSWFDTDRQDTTEGTGTLPVPPTRQSRRRPCPHPRYLSRVAR